MRIQTIWAMTRFMITACALFLIWLIFTSSFNPFSVTAGLLGSLGIAFLTYKVFIPRHNASRHGFIPRPFHLILFFFILIYYLYSSSIKMLVTIIHKNPNPRIVHFRTRLNSDLARMVLANSITFTPGTITLDLNDDHLTVHWFFCNTNHSKLAGETVKGKIEKHLRKVWL
ncbi:MAG: Na+/H+ antiporter subunit E [Spirochaetaceae bacterium]|jgi:multicomponent Na+:H+ antiporter subunit E|nr:Na+/H+ antiporter subunit E [Spirochaetaceae bacterium]